MPANSDKPHLWKQDALDSIDFFNDWYLRFAPMTYRHQRAIRTHEVAGALEITDHLRALTPDLLKAHPGVLPMLRMVTAPPIARDRLVGLAYTSKSLVLSMEGATGEPPRVPTRMPGNELDEHLVRIVDVIAEMADRDLFPWLEDSTRVPSLEELMRGASVVADRMCGASADPIIRNAQERRQLDALATFLAKCGYVEIQTKQFDSLLNMPPGTYAVRHTIVAGRKGSPVNIPIDCVISRHGRPPGELPLLLEAKSAGDATNTNKRRKEEAQKFAQLKQALGKHVQFVLFLCGYFEPGYLGYEASEGIDWVWEHRISDLHPLIGSDDETVSRSELTKEAHAPYLEEFPALELERLRRQKQVDASKSAFERNQMGQFSTPYALAYDIATYTMTLVARDQPCSVLEPASGSGVFVSALLALENLPSESHFTCVEIDPQYAAICRELYSDHRTQTATEDFFQYLDSEANRFDVIVTNPPYVRHHHIDSAEKQRLQGLVSDRLRITVSGLSGLYIYYVLLADTLLKESAVATWLIPCEFLYTNYGKALRTYLADRVTLLRIHRFDATDVQFDDALVSSCVVTYRKSPKPQGHSFELTSGRYDAPSSSRRVACESAVSLEKDVMREGVSAGPAQGTPLEELFHVTRGLATGCNSFFVLDEQTVRDKGLEPECLVPILPGPRYLKEEIVEADTQGFPLLKRRQFLLSVGLPPEEVKERFPNTFRYLEEGEAMGIHTGYICRSRKQWYFQEKRPAPMYLATYMGRGRPGSCPIRFILNRSIAVVANVFLCLYPRPSLLRLLQGHPERQEEVLAMLNAIPQAGLRDAGRCYGGGLQKVEPKELRSVRLSELPAWFPSPRLEQRDFLSLLSCAIADEHRVRAAEG